MRGNNYILQAQYRVGTRYGSTMGCLQTTTRDICIVKQHSIHKSLEQHMSRLEADIKRLEGRLTDRDSGQVLEEIRCRIMEYDEMAKPKPDYIGGSPVNPWHGLSNPPGQQTIYSKQRTTMELYFMTLLIYWPFLLTTTQSSIALAHTACRPK